MNRDGEGDNEMDLDDLKKKWENTKEIYNESAKMIIGFKKRKTQSSISADSWKAIEKRKQLKVEIDSVKSEKLKARKRKAYQQTDKQVKRSLR